MKKFTEESLNKAFKKIDKRFEIQDLAKELRAGTGASLDCFAIYYGGKDLAIFADQPKHGYVLRFTMLTVPANYLGREVIDDCFKGIQMARKEASRVNTNN